ncbi:MAG: ATP-binding protein [Planctomycetes bacterium]|nr:ATP-binding protein [Planctomycetota bacterium]
MGKRLEFPASPTIVRKLRAEVRGLAAELGATAEASDQLALVADEIVNNAIEHGTSYRRSGKLLALQVAVDGARLRVEFFDPEMPIELVGQLADALAAVSRDLPALESERGRGLFLLTVYLQELRADLEPSGGLRLVGYIGAP